MFWATALKLPVIVTIDTMPGMRKFRYGSPCDIVCTPRPNTSRYMSGEIMFATVIL